MSRTLLLALSLGLPALALASGNLDPRFSGDGIYLRNLGGPSSYDGATAGLIDAQGRVVAAGNTLGGNTGRTAFLLRVSPNGTTDSGFGDGGTARVLAPDGFLSVTWSDVVERPDGRLLVAGQAGTLAQDLIRRAYLCQFLPDGDPDPDFGTGGCMMPTIWDDSNRDEIVDLAVQPDGKVVAVGTTQADQDLPLEYFVVRLLDDGSFDRCLGDVTCQANGVLIEPETAPALQAFEPYSVAIAPDGRIVLGGSAVFQDQVDMAAVRLMPTGGVDETFGNGGHRLVAFDQGQFDIDFASEVLVAQNGRVMLVGSVQTAFGWIGGAALLDAEGDAVPTYGDGGRRMFFFNDVSSLQHPTAARLQSDSKLVVAGNPAEPGAEGDCGVLRLDTEGELDAIFGLDGKRTVDANHGEAPASLDSCPALDVRFGGIVLFGIGGPTDLTRDTLLIKIDQDAVFRDGYED